MKSSHSAALAANAAGAAAGAVQTGVLAVMRANSSS